MSWDRIEAHWDRVSDRLRDGWNRLEAGRAGKAETAAPRALVRTHREKDETTRPPRRRRD